MPQTKRIFEINALSAQEFRISFQGGQVGVVVALLAFHLKDPGSSHIAGGGALCGLGF